MNNVSHADATWYYYGTFIVTEPEDDDVKDNTSFESMDYTKLFNKPFDGDYTDEDYPNSFNALTDPENENRQSVSAVWIAQYTCKQVGVELATLTFTNHNMVFDGNPFRAGETCRDVMKAIGKLALSWVRIGWDNRCYIDFNNIGFDNIDMYDVIDYDQYYSLTKSETMKPIDGVGFGVRDVDGETALKIEEGKTIDTAENILYIYDNPLLYTYDLREQAVNSADVLFGLCFSQLETETIGHPWMYGCRPIDVKDMNNNHNYTYPFNIHIQYAGHIRSKINTIYTNEVEKTLGYESDIVRSLRDAWVQVNKITGEVSAQSRSISDIVDAQGNYYTIDEIDNLLLSYESGLTNNFSNTGGNNKFKNSALWFKDGNTYDYWTGDVKVITETSAGSQTAMLLQNSTLTQIISGIPNGKYTISFNYQRLVSGATLTVGIDLVSTSLGEQGTFEQTIDVTTNTIDFKLICNLTDGYKVYDLMCNSGVEKTVWTQHANETRTDTVNISKGMTITSTTTHAIFKADADGIRIDNTSDDPNYRTNFLDNGMSTYNAEIRGQATISGSLFTKIGNQTWINGL